MQVQFIEDYLRNEYKMPTWGIFATVAGVVILAGLLAGLVSSKIVLMFFGYYSNKNNNS